jgi:hypothetical protein
MCSVLSQCLGVEDRNLDSIDYCSGVIANKVCFTIRFVEEPSNYHYPSLPHAHPPPPCHIEEVLFDLGDFISLQFVSERYT